MPKRFAPVLDQNFYPEVLSLGMDTPEIITGSISLPCMTEISPVVSKMTARTDDMSKAFASRSFANTSARVTRVRSNAESMNLPLCTNITGSFSIVSRNVAEFFRKRATIYCSINNAAAAIRGCRKTSHSDALVAVARSDPVATVTIKSKAVILEKDRKPIRRTSTIIQVRPIALRAIPRITVSSTGAVTNI